MDKVSDYACKSLTRYLEIAMPTLDDSKVVSTDFDWDKKPAPSNLGNQQVARPLPFAGVVLVRDSDKPFSQGNILYDREILVHVELCCRSYTELVNLTADMRQALRSATNAATSGVGIPLYNYAVVSGAYYANAGTLQVDLGNSEFFGTETPLEQGNRKYLSITPVEMTAFKDVTATLLENMGRINLTDS